MDITPKVSIIIPVYNTEKYLPECLDSLLKQSLTEIEIICFNDASTDSSLEILQRYAEKDNRIVIINSPINVKQGSGRNEGIRASRAPFIMFVDPDDWVAPNFVEKYYLTAVNTNSDIVTGNYVSVMGSQREEMRFWTQEDYSSTDKIKALNLKCYVPFCMNIYRRELFFQNHLFFPEYIQLGEDRVLASALFLAAKKIAKIEDCLYFYRHHSESTSRKKDLSKFYMIIFTPLMTLQICRNIDKNNRFEKEINYQFIDQYYRQNIIGGLTNYSNNIINQIRYIKKTLSLYINKKDFNNFLRNQNASTRLILRSIKFSTNFGIFIFYLYNFYRKKLK